MIRYFDLPGPVGAACLCLALAAFPSLYGQHLQPSINSLSPSAAVAGSPGIALSINGANFQPGCSALWNTTPLPVTYVSSALVTANVPASLLAGVGVVSVSVTNPDGTVSNLSSFTITAAQIVITSTTLPQAKQGLPYSATLSVSGGVAPYTWTAVDTLPAGLTLSSGGTITGTPTVSGAFTFTVRVTDSLKLTTIQALSLAIAATPLTISNDPALPAAVIGKAYTVTFNPIGGTPPYHWGLTGTVPSGLSLNPNTGILSGTPTVAGANSFTIAVSDSTGISASKVFSLAVNAQPVTITTSATLLGGTVGSAYAQTFAATGGTTPYRWSITNGAVAGLAMDAGTGLLSGTPSAAGAFSITVQVADSAGQTATGVFSLSVTLPVISITTASPLPAGTVGVVYTQRFTAGGGTQPYTWSVTGAPAGFTMESAAGVLSGTPAAAESLSFTVQVSDKNGATTSKSFALTINPGALSITTDLQLPDAAIASAYDVMLAAAGGVPPYTWTSNGLPDGLALDPNTGEITGTPLAVGPLVFTARVTDAAKSSVLALFHITVNVPALPAITIAGLPNTAKPADQSQIKLGLGSAYTLDLTGRLILSFAADTGPGDSTIQFSSGGRSVDFTIPAGSTDAKFSVSNLGLQTGTVAGTITVSTQLLTAGVDITPNPAPAQKIRVERAAPVIASAHLVRSGSGFSIQITGYATSREMTQAVFQFKSSSGTLTQSQITIPIGSLFGTWFQDPASARFGSQFLFVQPFNVQGDATAITPDTVTLTNGVGSTTANVN
jgi:hypothetical protein